MGFNPREHLISIKNRQGAAEYLPVQWRLVWFRQECPQGTIETELVHLDLTAETEEEAFAWNAEKKRNEKVMKTAKGIAVFRATVKDGKGGVATATKMEKAASFPDYLEKAETGSIGRALAALGYGTQFTADELDEAHRIVDAPAATNGHTSEIPLADVLKQVKQRAMTCKVASNAQEWSGLLDHLKIEQVRNQADIDKISAHLDKFQQPQQ